MNSAWTPIGEGIAGEEWQPERDRNLKAQQDILGQIEAAREIEKKSRIEADSTRTLLEAQLIRVQAARVSGTTTTTAAAAGTTSATTAVSVAETEKQRAEAASQLLKWQAQAANAQSVIDSAQTRIESGTFSAADNASALQDRSAAEYQIQQFTAVLADLDAKLQLLTTPMPAAPAPAVQPVYQPAPAAPAPAFQVAPQMDSQSMQQAVDASQAQTALLQSFIDRIGREMAKQNEILRNNALIQ
jgi:hypothetical protein